MKDSIDFDQYELIPKAETFPPPKSDHSVALLTKAFQPPLVSAQPDPAISKLLKEKDVRIQELQAKLEKAIKQAEHKQNLNASFTEVLSKIKSLLEAPSIPVESLPAEIENRIATLNYQIRELQQRDSTKQSENKSEPDKNKSVFGGGEDNWMSKVVREKDDMIRDLKEKLLESTQNNINAIFHTELSAQECLQQQVSALKIQVEMLKRASINRAERDRKPEPEKHECPHHKKIVTLIKNYEEMLQEYHRNERIVSDLQNRQEQTFSYFSSMKADLLQTVQTNCNNYSDQRLRELEKRVSEALLGLSVPERVKTEGDNEGRNKQLLAEIERLNQKLTQKEVELFKVTQRLEEDARQRSWNQHQSHMGKISYLEGRLRDKEKRISVLENTIIDQIESKNFLESQHGDVTVRSLVTINSQQSDLEKQKSNVRNLKAVASKMKQENESLRLKIKDLTEASENSCGAEKVKCDELEMKVIEGMLGAIIEGNNSRCLCLERVTDALFQFTEENPELEELLIRMGVVATSSNLLPGVEGL